MNNEILELFTSKYFYNDVSIYDQKTFKDIISIHPDLYADDFLNLPSSFDIIDFEKYFYPISADFQIMVATKKMYSRQKHIVIGFYEKNDTVFIPIPDLGSQFEHITQDLGFVMNHNYFTGVKDYGFIHLMQITNGKIYNIFSALFEPKYEKSVLCKNLIEVIVTEAYTAENNHALNLKLYSNEKIIKQVTIEFDVEITTMQSIIEKFMLPFNLTKSELLSFSIQPALTADFVESFTPTDEILKLINI